MVRVLRVPGFLPLLAGQAVNAVGNWVAIIAIWGFAAFRFDAGAGDLALLFVVLAAPGALLGPLLGLPIDRLGPRRALVLANLLGVLDALALTQANSYQMVILLALPLGLIEAMATASLDALPPRLVHDRDLLRANALLDGAQHVAILVGPAIAALVYVRWGLAGAFLTDAATFLIGAVVALPLKIGPVERAAVESTWRELTAGLAIVRRSQGLKWTLAVAVSTYALWSLFGVLEPLYVRDVLKQTETTFALLQMVFGAGLVGAGLLLAVLGDGMARPRYVAASVIVSGATAAMYLSTRSLTVAYVGVFLWGVDVAFFFVPAKTLLQRYTPVAAHGRVLSLNQAIEPMTEVVVAPLAAVAVGLLGVRVLGAVGGAVAAGLGVVALVLARRLAPPPPSGPVDPTAGTSPRSRRPRWSGSRLSAGARVHVYHGEAAVTIASGTPEAGSLEATVLPDLGLLGVSLRHDGEEVLALPHGVIGYRKGHSTGLPFLAPWANRLSRWSYDAAGVAVDLRGLPLHTDADDHPIHGTMGAQPGVGDRRPPRWVVACPVRFRRPPRPAGFVPVPARDRGGPRRRRRVAGGGHHDPADRRAGGPGVVRVPPLPAPAAAPRSSWRVRLPDRRHLSLTADGLPTGGSEEEAAGWVTLGNTSFDDLYALGTDRSMTLEGGGRRVTVEMESGYPYAQVYAPPRWRFCCLEPMTAPTDGLVSGAHPTVAPGESFTARFSVTPRRTG